MRALPVVVIAFAAVVVAAPLARAHVETGNPISTSMKFGFERTKKLLLASADLMPAADYAFKPTPEVRSYGEVIGHVADASYMFCSAFKGTPAPKKDVEKTVTTKDGLKKALADALAYCDGVYSTANDSQLSQPLEMFGQKMIKFSALDINLAHDMEHYGNMVTYLRLKKLTPPSSMKEK
jgi:uncharacterized damage-inducible protein DinB